jgi:hypothetical protein
MRNWVLVVVGLVCLLVGGVWALQGFGVIGGSFMTDSPTWLVIGLVVAVVGLALLLVAVRGQRSRVR